MTTMASLYSSKRLLSSGSAVIFLNSFPALKFIIIHPSTMSSRSGSGSSSVSHISLDAVPATPPSGPPTLLLQSIPATIQHNGPARIKDFFSRHVTKSDPQDPHLLSGTLRGFPLDGRAVATPTGYDVLVLQDGGDRVAHMGDHQPQERVWQATHRLSGFTQWNYDQIPSSSDGVAKALKWVHLARAIHAEDPEDEGHTKG